MSIEPRLLTASQLEYIAARSGREWAVPDRAHLLAHIAALDAERATDAQAFASPGARIANLEHELADLRESETTQATRIAALEKRQQELLEPIVRLTNETPFPDEVKGWESQRAAMVAEIGTLKAVAREQAATIAMLSRTATSDRALIDEQSSELIAAFEEISKFAARAREESRERDAYRSMLCDLVASNRTHGPASCTMTRAWTRARELLKNGPVKP